MKHAHIKILDDLILTQKYVDLIRSNSTNYR